MGKFELSSKEIELLDQFATAIIQGRVAAASGNVNFVDRFYVSYAYDLAEMMVAERKKRIEKLLLLD